MVVNQQVNPKCEFRVECAVRNRHDISIKTLDTKDYAVLRTSYSHPESGSNVYQNGRKIKDSTKSKEKSEVQGEISAQNARAFFFRRIFFFSSVVTFDQVPD